MAGEARYLDPAIVARLGTIDLKARTIVEGFLTGLHRSPYKGFPGAWEVREAWWPEPPSRDS